MAARRRTAVRTALVAVLGLVLTAALPAAAQGRAEHGQPRLTLMTRNLYLGSSLAPALLARTPQDFLTAVATVYGTAQASSFPARAEAVADEIAATRPDLIGLQEVSQWLTTGPGTPPSQDFLVLLRRALRDRGLRYAVAAVSHNADIGPVPLVTPCGSTVVGACTVTLTDRDVILADRRTRGLRWFHPRSGRYTAQQTFTPPVPGAPAVSFDRGWASIDGTYRGARFHLAATHLETEDFPAVQQAQAREFLAGPAFGRGADLAVGDMNSAADGSTTASYRLLTRRFTDAWAKVGRGPGLTCCQSPTLTNPASELASRIDLVLSHGTARAVRARLVGSRPFQGTPPLWASDHAGVVATLLLGR